MVALSRIEEETLRSTIEKDEADLERYVQAQGWTITARSQRARDGNCWASAIAFAFNNELAWTKDPETVRKEAVAALLEHKDHFSNFFVRSDNHPDATFDEECEFLKTGGRYKSDRSNIGDLVLTAFAWSSRVVIKIFDSKSNTLTVGEESNGEILGTIHVALVVTPGHEHYHGLEQQVIQASQQVRYCSSLH